MSVLISRKQSLLWLLNISVIVVFCWILSDLFHITDNQELSYLSSSAPRDQNIIFQQDFKTANNISVAAKTIIKKRNHVRRRQCSFLVPSLRRRVEFSCGQGDFVSVVKSVCKTQLGNQLSSYAALLFFTVKYGYHAFLDPVQTRSIGLVFKIQKLSIGTFDFYSCGCVPGAQHWTRPLDLHSSGVAVGMIRDWDPGDYNRNHLIGLGAHSVPLFLIKQVLSEVRQELVFKDKLVHMASKILRQITRNISCEAVVVGVHVRRGDKLRVWRQSNQIRDILGRYEGDYFRYSMNLMRQRYNSQSRKVVFIVTSDDMTWSKTQLGNTSDTFFSADFTNAPAKGPTSLGLDLAVLSMANHTIMDYGTFGLWAGLLSGGTILAPTGYTRGESLSPDLVWWRAANMSNVELIDINNINQSSVTN